VHVSSARSPNARKRAEVFYSKPEGPRKFVIVLLGKLAQLRALERHERRALSQLKFAIRAFSVAAR